MIKGKIGKVIEAMHSPRKIVTVPKRRSAKGIFGDFPAVRF
jgi:hypothetical protein